MNSARIAAALALLLLAAAGAPAQHTQQRPSASKDTAPSDTARHGSAWTLRLPLGERVPADMDTLPYNYQRQAIPSMQSDAFVTTGNLGAPGLNLIFDRRPERGPFFFSRALDAWMTTASNRRFYNVYTPMTLASYNFGGNRDSNQDRLRAQFAGNVNRRIGIGAHMDYLYSKGSYSQQAVKDYIYGMTFYYLGDRYEAQAMWNQNNMLNKENGGITDDRYITDPAAMQGGVSKIEPKSIPTRLTTAHSLLHTSRLYMSHAYKVGYWRDERVNDTLTRQQYVPVVKFIYSLDWRRARHKFVNFNASEAADFWSNRYIDASRTADRTAYYSLANTLGVAMLEGFRPWVRFGLSAYATYELRHYTQTPYDTVGTGLTPLPDAFRVPHSASQHMLWAGGRLDKTRGETLTYAADARFGLLGDAAGDMELNGTAATRFRLGRDTVALAAFVSFANTEPDYLLNHYLGNHFAWHNDFGKTRTLAFGGSLDIPWTDTRLEAGLRNVQNLIYFDAFSLPQQESGSTQVLTLRLRQRLRLGILHWDNTLTWQECSRQSVLPLPRLTVYSNLYLLFRAFRVLALQIGVDCDYYTRYGGYMYQPATMTFHVGRGQSVGNYAFCNAYLTARLYRTRFYVLWSHFNQGWFGSDYFAMRGYPLNPRRLQLGLSVDFAN